MIHADNQTKHFYAMKSGDKVIVKDLADSNLFRINVTDEDDEILATSDVINRKLVLKAKISEVEPTYYRKWTVTAPTTVTASKTYHVYFYLENMIGYGMQDRWDRVASYTAKDGDTVANVMTALKEDLDLKLNAAGPIKDDFTVTDGERNSIVVTENKNSDTYQYGTEMDMLIHNYPYLYNVTMSTFDGETAWTNKVIVAENTTDERISAATKVLDMERYFLRNRGDKYQLTKPFDVSIINKSNTDTAASAYYTLDIDYAFSDTQGYTYHSNKQISIACPTRSVLETLMTKILNDSNEDSYSQAAANTTSTGD